MSFLSHGMTTLMAIMLLCSDVSRFFAAPSADGIGFVDASVAASRVSRIR